MLKKFSQAAALWCLAIALFGIASAKAQPAASEYEVKAAFLYNFIKFVEWPPKAYFDRNAPLIIGVLGENPFSSPSEATNYLDQAVTGKIINERKIVVKYSDRLADLTHCQLLFVGKSERNRIKDILANVSGMTILTVGETDNFCQQGGVINFVMQSEKVRFEINVGAAEKAGLKISSKLLNVAKVVQAQTP
jgi:hypothetical protein